MLEGLHHGEQDLAMRAGIALAVRRSCRGGFDKGVLGDTPHHW
jgi:hypothetical protein